MFVKLLTNNFWINYLMVIEVGVKVVSQQSLHNRTSFNYPQLET